MFNEEVAQTPIYAHNSKQYHDIFNGDSLLEQGVFTSEIGKDEKAETRTVEKDAIIDVYRNLNKTNFYSIRNRSGDFKNKVSGYAHAVIVRHPEFIVSKAGRARVQKEKRKKVLSGQKTVSTW
jgi:hypothetical protein